ncbi:hypothetical protein LX97_03349 [Nonlabens dokdonensis]|jgi:hypothetical protein|uniref:Uncharacterized protein n=2 Tax=Nonlabens dokdonensis TaxID=328515 RepID=L7WAT0_NONDD|nr:hypothetical protein [Nonlabens dokdonensis]AGC76981.1 hypothetical protein DDD_1854 [Nonlabens dokdonensis DSW-6]PZX36884.1 hypothetical protein LX97_03349 [Nonlabens dokdonensis]
MDDRLGETPNSYFRNRFKEINGNLFVWKDTITPLKSDILQIIDKYKVLDSTDIKRRLGVLPKDFIDNRIVTMDHGLKSTHYYICKNQLNKYKKVKSSVAYGYYRVPDVNCPDNGNELGNGSK